MFKIKKYKLYSNPVKSQIDTINPYYRTAEILLDRLKYDLHPYSWSSRNKINRLKNKYSGKKAVILCNGPSLLDVDFNLLTDVYTYGLNKINLIFDKTDFRPSSIVSINPFVIEQNKEFFKKTDSQLFLDFNAAKKFIPNKKNIIYLHSTGINKFARDCSMSIYQGSTVTFAALQLAFHMGFKKVAIVGCDHYFNNSGTPNMAVKKGDNEKDLDHFDKEYFSDGQVWQYPDIERSEESYRLANDVYSTFGREIINATNGGKLEIFKRMDLESFLAE